MAATIHEGKGPLAEADLQTAELALGVKFPPDYCAFLLQLNGGYPEPDGIRLHRQPEQACRDEWGTTAMSWFYSVTDERVGNLVRINLVSLRDRLPLDTVAIGSDAGGNQLLLALGGPHAGKVLLWIQDHEASDGEAPGYDNVGFVADSFADFIEHRLTETP